MNAQDEIIIIHTPVNNFSENIEDLLILKLFENIICTFSISFQVTNCDAVDKVPHCPSSTTNDLAVEETASATKTEKPISPTLPGKTEFQNGTHPSSGFLGTKNQATEGHNWKKLYVLTKTCQQRPHAERLCLGRSYLGRPPLGRPFPVSHT